jgi:hypothetical protein
MVSTPASSPYAVFRAADWPSLLLPVCATPVRGRPQRRLHDVKTDPLCRKGSERSRPNAYATLTDKTDVKSCSRLGSPCVLVCVAPENQLVGKGFLHKQSDLVASSTQLCHADPHNLHILTRPDAIRDSKEDSSTSRELHNSQTAPQY